MTYKLIGKKLGQSKRLLLTEGKPQIFPDQYAAEGRIDELKAKMPSLTVIAAETISDEMSESIYLYYGYDKEGKKLTESEKIVKTEAFTQRTKKEPNRGW